MSKATYVYCLITSQRSPPSARGVRGLPGTGQVRFLPIDSPGTSRPKSRLKKWLVVADAPLADYGEAVINRRLNDLDWVARRALAHEAVVESMMNAAAILPMKLFTIFTSDERAIGHVEHDRARIDAILERVAGRQEWGVRVVLAPAPRIAKAAGRRIATGSRYLAAKKAAREERAERVVRADRVVTTLYDRLAKLGDAATRRSAVEELADAGPLLLDAAFLVPQRRRTRFRTTLGREAVRLQEQGYGLTVSGPWPPYSFVER
jgi:hypothetical protein